MTVRAEHHEGVADLKDLKSHLEKVLREDLGVRVTVELVAPGSLAELTNFGREGKVR